MSVAALKEELEREIAVRVLGASAVRTTETGWRLRLLRRFVFRGPGLKLLLRHVPPDTCLVYHGDLQCVLIVRSIESDGKVLFVSPPLFAPLEQFLEHVLDGTVRDP